jgi:hypothetical protein
MAADEYAGRALGEHRIDLRDLKCPARAAVQNAPEVHQQV